MSLLSPFFNRLQLALWLILCLIYVDTAKAQPFLFSFPLHQVRSLEGPFKEAQQTDMTYILAMDPDRLLAPYLLQAGLEPKKERYGNWSSFAISYKIRHLTL